MVLKLGHVASTSQSGSRTYGDKKTKHIVQRGVQRTARKRREGGCGMVFVGGGGGGGGVGGERKKETR